MSCLNNHYSFQNHLHYPTTSNLNKGGALQTPKQIDNIIETNIAPKPVLKRQKAEHNLEEAPLTNDEIYKAFQKLEFSSKRKNKKQVLGGSIAEF